MIGGISYVTLCMAKGETPHVSVSLYPDASAKFSAAMLASGKPLLTIQHGETEVNLWPQNPEKIGDDDLANARRLVEAATTYLELCEDICAESSTT